MRIAHRGGDGHPPQMHFEVWSRITSFDGTLSDAALSQCLAAGTLKGEANARKALQVSKQAFGPRTGTTGGTSYALAFCLIGMDKLQEASELLQSIDVKAVTQLSGDSMVEADIALAQGQIAAQRGDYLLAQRYAQTAAPALDCPNARAYDRQSLQELRKAINAQLHASR